MDKNEVLLPEHGELFTLYDFIDECSLGNFTDRSGRGYYSDGRVYWLDKPVKPSDMVRYKISFNTKHRFVIWFK